MPNKRYKAEQIVNLLRQTEVEIANGKTTPQAAREVGITGQTYSRWRREFGGLKLGQARRQDVTIADADRRIPSGVPDDPGGA